MRLEGTIKSWDDERGFGFIEPIQGGEDVFFHISEFSSRSGRPRLQQPVSFEVQPWPRGRIRAKNVTAVTIRRPHPLLPIRLIAIPAFIALYAAVDAMWKPHPIVAAIYLAASIWTYVVFAFDKRAAERGLWRTPESTLLACSLACGWPGALLAQQFHRHKTSKPKFQAEFWSIVILNLTGFVVLACPVIQRSLADFSKLTERSTRPVPAVYAIPSSAAEETLTDRPIGRDAMDAAAVQIVPAPRRPITKSRN